MEKMAYFDNAATTFPKPEYVYDFTNQFYRECGVNVGRGQYKLASKASALVQETRELLLELFHCPAKKVVFTHTATEAINLILRGLPINNNYTVYLSPFEHNAVTRVLYHLQTMYDIHVETLCFDKETMTYDMARIRNQFAENKPNWTVISHASNICGVVSPIKELCHLSKEFGSINIVDMCQTAGLVDTDLSGEDIDFAVFAGHKTLYSPLGVAGVVSSFTIKPQPLMFGGTGFESANQSLPETIPERYEVASPDIAAISGLNASLKWIKEIGIQNIYDKEQANHERLLKILSRFENIKLIDTAKAMAIGVVSCLFEGYGSDSIGQILSEQGVAVRTGLHCAPTAHKFIGTFPAGTVRFTSNYKSIANYLETQDERFFNSLILAVYNGQPKWNEIRIQDEKGEDNYNLGIITLTDDVKIFPVDGQHRVAGIKKAIEDKPEMKSERVPVIFIGHSTDEIGMQRTRRMFSTLNRYAKPVSLRDIIALDEDDVVAIASRYLIDNTDLFVDNRILDSKNKSIPETNDMALTTIITYYECNKELLWLFVKDIDVVGLEEKTVKGRSKINEYIRHRPKNEIIAAFTEECKDFWEAILNYCPEIKKPNVKVERYRDSNGGSLFFRPIALYPFAKVAVRIKEKYQKSYSEIIGSIPNELLWIQNRLWKKIIWDDVAKKMVMGNAKLVELILLYITAPQLLADKEKEKIIDNLKSIWDESDDIVVKERLDSIIRGDEYV